MPARLGQAGTVVADLLQQAERHDFEHWRLIGNLMQAIVEGLVAVGADDVEPAVLSAHIATLTERLETMRTTGPLTFLTSFDAVLARLLTAAGQPDQARARLDTALQLAEDTGVHFYDAELLRLRAHTRTDSGDRQADITAAFELARRQGAVVFELRAAVDDFELRGQPARAALADVLSRFPADCPLPELARARAVLG